MKSVPNSDIFVSKMQNTQFPTDTQQENRPVSVFFVDKDELAPLFPPLTVDNLADLASLALDIPAQDFMTT